MKFLFLVVLLHMDITHAQVQVFDNTEDAAIKTAAKAFMAIPEVKDRLKYLEGYFVNSLPVEKDVAAVFGGITFTLINGRISTKSIKNMDVDFLGGRLRADFSYNINNNSTEGFLNCKWNINQLTD